MLQSASSKWTETPLSPTRISATSITPTNAPQARSMREMSRKDSCVAPVLGMAGRRNAYGREAISWSEGWCRVRSRASGHFRSSSARRWRDPPKCCGATDFVLGPTPLSSGTTCPFRSSPNSGLIQQLYRGQTQRMLRVGAGGLAVAHGPAPGRMSGLSCIIDAGPNRHQQLLNYVL